MTARLTHLQSRSRMVGTSSLIGYPWSTQSRHAAERQYPKTWGAQAGILRRGASREGSIGIQKSQTSEYPNGTAISPVFEHIFSPNRVRLPRATYAYDSVPACPTEPGVGKTARDRKVREWPRCKPVERI